MDLCFGFICSMRELSRIIVVPLNTQSTGFTVLNPAILNAASGGILRLIQAGSDIPDVINRARTRAPTLLEIIPEEADARHRLANNYSVQAKCALLVCIIYAIIYSLHG